MFTSAREALAASHHITGSWRRTGAFLGLSGSEARWIVLSGREPRKPEIRAALGLSVQQTVTGAVVLAPERVCACGCRRSFVPVVPHQRRLPGHPRRRAVDRN